MMTQRQQRTDSEFSVPSHQGTRKKFHFRVYGTVHGIVMKRENDRV